MDEPLSFDDCRLLGSFSNDTTLRAASQRLGVPRATVSRQLSALEARLGHDLFLRNGRRLIPTRFGVAMLQRCEAALTSFREVQTAAFGGHAFDRRFTIAASPLFAETVLPIVLPEMIEAYPELTWELRLSHEYSDLFEGDVDVALRRGPLPNSGSLTARKLGPLTMVCVAAPARSPELAGDDDATLKNGPWIRVGAALEPFPIEVNRGRRRRFVTVMPRVAVDSQMLAIALARSGPGIARVNEFLVRDHLVRGELAEVFPSARSTQFAYVVRGIRKSRRGAMRDFTSRLAAACDKLEIWDE